MFVQKEIPLTHSISLNGEIILKLLPGQICPEILNVLYDQILY